MKKIFLLLLFPLLSPISAYSDYSITFEEFKKRLENVFEEEQFSSLRSYLPEQFEIWGYDVGDFSGDEEPDVALSVRPKNMKEKKVIVFFCISEENSFMAVSRIPVSYFEIPIEVGFTIERGICFMTAKERNHHWFITGYTFRNGSFLLVDRFEVGRRHIGSERSTEIGYEVFNNYLDLSSSESFFNVSNGKLFLKTLYYTFPAYRTTRRVLPDFAVELRDTSTKYFVTGKEVWKGAKDLSFSAKVAYDESSLYLFITVVDDALVIRPSSLQDGDHIVLWFDLKGTRMNPSSGTAPNFRLQPDSDVMSISISPGDFRKKGPQVNLLLRQDPTERQQRGIKAISVLSKKRPDGYVVNAIIPFSALALEKVPSSLGFTLEVKDIDGQGGSFAKKSLATSQLREWDPSTLGVMRFIPDREFYGEVRNLLIEELLERIKDVGI